MTGDELRLEALLRRKGAWFDGGGLPLTVASSRMEATRAIAEAFPTFETMRDIALGRRGGSMADPARARLAVVLTEAGVLEPSHTSLEPTSAEAQRYLRGGWLEEYAGLAALAAGADEVRIGQQVRWMVKGFQGLNEIDTIARFGANIVFISAKALRSRLDVSDVRHREHLMDALQEADNLVDHFGDANSSVVLLVTTDLFDERNNVPRYEQLHGKAAALAVELVSLELMEWDNLVTRLARLGERVPT